MAKQSYRYVAICFALFVSLAEAGEPRFNFHIPQQTADGALTTLADQADISVVFDYRAISQHRTQRVVGHYSLRQAVDRLLAGTRLSYSFDRNGHLIVTVNNNQGIEMMNSKKRLLASVVGFFVGTGGAPG